MHDKKGGTGEGEKRRRDEEVKWRRRKNGRGRRKVRMGKEWGQEGKAGTAEDKVKNQAGESTLKTKAENKRQKSLVAS